MFKNFNYCYCFNSLKYVRFTNDGSFILQGIVQYTLNHSTITEQAVLTKGHTKKITLPVSALNICLNMLNLSDPDPVTSVIHHECISGKENICFKTFNTAQNPMFTRTIC